MENGDRPSVRPKMAVLTPKAIIHQKFGSAACYIVEEVREPLQNDCPGLAISLKRPCLYRCTLQLPELTVESECFNKKRDAEQSAAEIALLKLCIHPSTSDPMEISPWDDLTSRILYLFTDEFPIGTHPTCGHFRAALRRNGDFFGFIPIPAIAVCDKLGNICKSFDPLVEKNPCLAISHILKAAASLSESILTYEGGLWLRRQKPYPPEVLDSLKNCSPVKNIGLRVIYIPCSIKDAVEARTLNIASDGYYLDAIALELGLPDASEVLVSRIIGKSSSETRLYFSASGNLMLDCFNAAKQATDNCHFNHRATFLSGQDIYGGALMASVGYTWRSADLFHEDLTLQTYYRMITSKTPSGIYKLSREATLTAELPVTFTSRVNWRGSLPKELLFTFCRQHRLSEPVLSIETLPETSSKSQGSCEKMEDMGAAANSKSNRNDVSSCDEKSNKLKYCFRCGIKIFKQENLILEYMPKGTHKKQQDAVHSSSLTVLLWFNNSLKEPEMPLKSLLSSAAALQINIDVQSFQKEFATYQFLHNKRDSDKAEGGTALLSNGKTKSVITQPNEVCSSKMDDGTGVLLSNGSVVCISYAVSLVEEGEHVKELLESSLNFEFEIGVGAVLPDLEVLVTQMSVNQSARFHMESLRDIILAAAGDSSKIPSILSSESCHLEYDFTLLKVTEPLEDRMEQAFFSPPLSKQRVEFAVSYIRRSSATTLIDFGCGSGSLLDSLLDYHTSLEKVVGVDISQKSLARAAKMLHSKLSRDSDVAVPISNLRSAILYEGSIIECDSQLCGFDIGTCLEVIEHMEEDEAFKFGDVVLSYFRPKLLIVSTPNYEYNVILQGGNGQKQDEDPDENSHSQGCRFRNHDHKFEWNRDQFNSWASELARKHKYSVEFGGVGGTEGVEPGFASQIAVFRRMGVLQGESDIGVGMDVHHCQTVWEWNRSSSVGDGAVSSA
uniref:Small RNA 2'-O-methyltransferase n=2 Tax=Kalanchoe fedtschenkoi TaxID=63787 RepID=A0A7N0RDP3_KALFE